MLPLLSRNDTRREPRSGQIALGRPLRWLLALLGGGTLAMLALAVCLRPDPRGWGTHMQLGLPPCTSMSLLGTRCPACGMTTSWAMLWHGQPVEAVRANAGGALLAAAAPLVVLWSFGSALCGRWLCKIKESTLLIAATVAVSITMLQWLGRWLANR